MDPNATLAMIRQAISDLAGDSDDTSHPNYAELIEMDTEQIIDLFTALDGWLSSGGFLPSDWGKGRS
jgi:hypothetical protein